MKLLSLLTQPMDHCEDATARLLKELNIQYTKSHLQKELIEHPNYPSLASIVDVMGIVYNISSVAIRISAEDFKKSSDLDYPLLAQIRNRNMPHDVFVVVTGFSNDTVTLYNSGTKKNETLSFDTFKTVFKEVILAVETGSKTKEPNYEKHLKAEQQILLINSVALWLLPSITLTISLIYLYGSFTGYALTALVTLILILSGSFITSILLWHEIDEFNPVIKQVCQASTKVNCSAVLNSKASKILGLSWSSIGFAYFTGMLLWLLVTGVSHTSLVLSAWFNLVTLAYPIFSIYYQWKVVKQWCLLCLGVQIILLFLFITALAGGLYNTSSFSSLTILSLFSFLASFSFTFVAILVLIPVLQKAKTSKQKTIELQRIKHNPLVFEGVLAKQKEIKKPSYDLGISMGNPGSTYRLIKVCNPYCGPCSEAHPIIDDLIASNDEVSLQIIFTSTNDENDSKKDP
ncbi:vitamin K epoxide reductase family protein [Niabella hibiscisoli]|uniref:vitamin K epoxide reductase family protein n=1 Tax=Niabella hibiscisoli TaxID=1825928 RepID=UPI001F0F8FE1|nr:vitamin K epoxide reductase family protein [Niabella hibiscisoli]MCH5716249.1 vitamin K epoxide reductase family protein [Niabella hibiscisoli]